MANINMDHVGFHVAEFEPLAEEQKCFSACKVCGKKCDDCGATWEFHGLYWGKPSHGMCHNDGCAAIANLMAECEVERLSPGIMAVRELELRAALPW